MRHEENQVASRVVFARGLPEDCLESELLALCMPFSSVDKVLMIPTKNQAFVELPDTTAATSLIQFYQTRDAVIRGKKVFFAFSSRGTICASKPTDIKTFRDSSPRRRSRDRPERYPSPRRAASNGARGRPLSPPRHHDRYAPRPQASYPAPYEPTPVHRPPPSYLPPAGRRKILLVTVTNLEYEVKVDTLHQVFQSYGSVLKIATYFKSSEFKALVEMLTPEQAEAACQALHGRDIYTGCNRLHISMSDHSFLTVRYNNELSRDFTQHNLPPEAHRLETTIRGAPLRVLTTPVVPLLATWPPGGRFHAPMTPKPRLLATLLLGARLLAIWTLEAPHLVTMMPAGLPREASTRGAVCPKPLNRGV
ncbi:polypyrimidine tract-binding protein [Achlya hypogyna]|uniref:Polypyrimidine tract-binding protein n=1 Tax=Achlya hypogyna TaxID=1202772 RepID=A0A1V9Z6F8_ACHHY|nr:polypyrimidine tract-binding protein [Achlya hypogyna]